MNLAAIVLAAGASTRFGADKLCAPLHGEPLLFHAIRAARAAPVRKVTVVCPTGLEIGRWPGTPPVQRRAVASLAMSASLQAGIAACAEADGIFVFLGDMPLVPRGLAVTLAGALHDNFAVQPVHDGKPGHPVLLGRAAFAAVAALQGDQGAGPLLRTHRDVVRLEIAEPGVRLDIDRPQDLARLTGRSG